MKPKIIRTSAKEIFTKSKLAGGGYTINHCIGCGHNCTYCYARFMAQWKGFGQWGSWIEVKENAAELVKGKAEYLRIIPGSVSPFCLMFDICNRVKFYLDQDYAIGPFVNFHPLRNDMTVGMTPKEFYASVCKMRKENQVLGSSVLGGVTLKEGTKVFVEAGKLAFESTSDVENSSILVICIPEK